MKAKIIAFGLVFVFLLSVTVGMASALSNSGGGDWKYYKQITIKENSGKKLTDFQVLVELNPSNFPTNAKSDGSDLRFEDASGKELNYWREEWNAGAKEAKIWVKVPSIPANGETKIKMYYGNPSASVVSDGEQVFEFFDDFDGSDIDTSKWSVTVEPGAGYSASNGVLKFWGANSPNFRIRSYDTFTSDVLEAYASLSADSWGTGIEFDGYKFQSKDATDIGLIVHEFYVGGVGKIATNAFSPDIWYRFAVKRDVYGDATYYVDGFEKASAEVTHTAAKQVVIDTEAAGHSYIDWVLVRKYASPEPTLNLSPEIPMGRKPKFEISGPHIIPKYLSPNLIVENALLGTYIDNEIKLGISNDEYVKKVICKFKSPAGFIAVQELELSKTGGLVKADGYEYYNYEGEIKARSLKPLIGWLISFFGTGFSSHADAHKALIDLTPPVTLEKVIITGVYGTEHEFDVNKPLISIEDQIFSSSPINPAFLDYKYVATYSPVHILITDEEGNKIGWEESNKFKEIENAVYSGADIHPEFIILFQPKLAYSLNVSGVKSGDFTLHIVSANATAKTVSKFEKVPATANTKAFIQITEKAQEMRVDYDGDEKIDEEKEPVSEVIEVIPEIPTPTSTPTPTPPGFEAVFALIGLLMVAYILRWGR